MTLVEQLGSGTMYCQILDVIYPGQVPLSKVKWGAKLEYDFLHNFKILQQSFDKLQVSKTIPVNKLAKAKYQDNLEFAQWIKAYFDFNCKDKGRGYDAVKRRGNATPYFGFCKGGVLPKQTLFFRNPNEKFTVDDFSSSSFSSQHEQEFPDHESTSSNNNNNSILFRSESTPLKQTSFFSNSSPLSSEGLQLVQRQQQSKLPQQYLKSSTSQQQGSSQYSSNQFFNRGEKQEQQLQNTKSNYFFDGNKQNQNQSNFFNKNESQNPQQKVQDQSSTLFFSNNISQNSSEVTRRVYQSNVFQDQQQTTSKIQESFLLNNSQQEQSTNSNYIIENNFFNRGRGDNSNSQNSNNFFSKNTEDISPRYFNKLSTDKQSEKKAPQMSTSNLLSKIQQLTEASQILLRKNSETSEKSNSNMIYRQSSKDNYFNDDKSHGNTLQQQINEIKANNNATSFSQHLFNNNTTTSSGNDNNKTINSIQNSNAQYSNDNNESKIDLFGFSHKANQEENIDKQVFPINQNSLESKELTSEIQHHNSQNSVQSPLIDNNFFTKIQQNQKQNGQANSNSILEKDSNNQIKYQDQQQSLSIGQQQTKYMNNNFFGNNSDSEESNILNGNIFSQESVPSQFQQTKEIQFDQIVENKIEIENISSEKQLQTQQNRQNLEEPKKTENEINKTVEKQEQQEDEDEDEDADISNSYETPIYKKQKKNEENNNFSKSLDKYNQKTIQLINKENISSSEKQDNNQDPQNKLINNYLSSKEKVQQILSIIQSCQEDYDTAMKQILGVCMP